MTACFGVRDIERFLLLKRLASWWPGQAICSQEHIHSLPSDLGRRTIGAATARSEEHTSELQSLMRISYAVFCLKKKIICNTHTYTHKTSAHAGKAIISTIFMHISH